MNSEQIFGDVVTVPLPTEAESLCSASPKKRGWKSMSENSLATFHDSQTRAAFAPQIPPKPQNSTGSPINRTWIDLTTGSRQHGIRSPVYLESNIPDIYSEVDYGLGLNAAGLILSVLAHQWHASRKVPEAITVTLRRKTDHRLVEVNLHLHQFRISAQDFVSVRLDSEKEFHPEESSLASATEKQKTRPFMKSSSNE